VHCYGAQEAVKLHIEVFEFSGVKRKVHCELQGSLVPVLWGKGKEDTGTRTLHPTTQNTG